MEIKRLLTAFSLAALVATAACDAEEPADSTGELSPEQIQEIEGTPANPAPVAPEVTEGAIIADTSKAARDRVEAEMRAGAVAEEPAQP